MEPLTLAKNVYWMRSILVEDEFGMSRDELMLELEKKGIEPKFRHSGKQEKIRVNPCLKFKYQNVKRRNKGQ